MNNFEARLMVSSREVDPKDSGWPFNLRVFFSDKRHNSECNFGNFRRFLFGMSPDVPAIKVHVLPSDF